MTTGRIASRKQGNSASTLPEVGKIKIGEKVKNAKGIEYPTSLDYFRATGNYANEFKAVYGDKPKRLNIAFISDNIEEVCNQRFESWVSGKRYGWGDGINFTVFDKNVGEKGSYVECSSDDSRVKALKWDETLTLRFVLLNMPGLMGYWSLQTKAKAVTIPSIVKSFDFVRERAGSIVGFPFNLIVEKKTGYNPGEAKNYPVISLVPNFTEESIEQVRQYLDTGGAMSRLTTKMISENRVLEVLEAKQLSEGKK